MKSWASSSRGPGGTAGETFLQARLPPDLHTPAEARELLKALRRHIDPSVLDSLLLVVSELVTNSVRHGRLAPGEHIAVSVGVQPQVVRVAVTDPGGAFVERPPPADPTRAVGWGLYLVERLAGRWGVRHDGTTEVWAELEC